MTQTTTYIITRRRLYYDGTLNVCRDAVAIERRETGRVEYATREEARQAVAELEAGTYELAHGEYASPIYRVLRSGTLRAQAALRRAGL